MMGIGMPMTPELGQAIEASLDDLHDTNAVLGRGQRLLQLRRAACDVDALLPPETCTRLREVKGRWDPDGMIVANHPALCQAA